MNNQPQPPSNDPKHAWQSQRTEHADMSLIEIQKKLRKIQLRNRISVLGGLVALFIFGRAFMQDPTLLWRIAWGLIILGTLHMMVVISRIWSGTLASDAALTTTLQFYRTRLNRFREFRRRSGIGLVLFFGGTMILVSGVMIAALRHPAPLKAVLPFCLILAAWGISYIVIGRRQRLWIKRELETLDLLEKENR